MAKCNTNAMMALLLIGLILVAGLQGTASAGSAIGHSRKLAQWGYRSTSNVQANSVRAQAATSQAIEEAVRSGGSYGSTRRAGVTGTATAWAAGQRNDVYNTVDRASFYG